MSVLTRRIGGVVELFARRSCLILVLAVLGGSVSVSAPAAGEDGSIEGRWLTGKRKAAVMLFSCGAEICGRLDWMAKPRYRGGELKIDRENPDPALRDRPWCGIDIIWGLRPAGPGIWTDGDLYNPKDGATYSVEIERRGAELRVRAYLGIKVLGKTEEWIRAPDDLPGCATQN